MQSLLNEVPRSNLFVSDFRLHSIGVVMSRFGQIEGYVAFVDGLGIGVSMGILRIPVTALKDVANACASHGLDFDDAYQYTVAEQNGIGLVSLDSDFDRTPRGRLTPAAALQHFKTQPQQDI